MSVGGISNLFLISRIWATGSHSHAYGMLYKISLVEELRDWLSCMEQPCCEPPMETAPWNRSGAISRIWDCLQLLASKKPGGSPCHIASRTWMLPTIYRSLEENSELQKEGSLASILTAVSWDLGKRTCNIWPMETEIMSRCCVKSLNLWL